MAVVIYTNVFLSNREMTSTDAGQNRRITRVQEPGTAFNIRDALHGQSCRNLQKGFV